MLPISQKIVIALIALRIVLLVLGSLLMLCLYLSFINLLAIDFLLALPLLSAQYSSTNAPDMIKILCTDGLFLVILGYCFFNVDASAYIKDINLLLMLVRTIIAAGFYIILGNKHPSLDQEVLQAILTSDDTIPDIKLKYPTEIEYTQKKLLQNNSIKLKTHSARKNAIESPKKYYSC